MLAAAEAARALAPGQPPTGGAETPPGETPAPAADASRESALVRANRQKERELVQRGQELAARERAMGQSVDQRVERAVAERMAKFKGDPIAALRELGFDDQTIASRLLNQGKQTPDELAKQALDATNKLREEQAQRAQSETRAQAERAFGDEATKDDVYPHLNAEWTRQEAVREAHEVVANLRAKGIDPAQYSLADIAKFLDQRAKARAGRREKLLAERSKKEAPQGDTKAGGNGGSDQGNRSGQTATTTIGKGLAGRETVSAKPGYLMSDAELAAKVDEEVRNRRATA